MVAAKQANHYTIKKALQFIEAKWLAGKFETPILLAGAPGIGKTEGIQEIFKRHGIPVYEHRIGNMDPSDVRGIPMPEKTDEFGWVCRDVLPDENVLPRRGPCVLFLDELGHAKPATLNAWMPILKERKISTYRAPKDMLIIAATNRIDDRAGSNSIHSAAINRVIRIDVQHDVKDWLTWAQQDPKDDGVSRVHPSITSYIAWKNDALFQQNKDNTGEDMPFPSPRSWVNLSRNIANEDGEPAVDKAFWEMVAHGCVGPAQAIQWMKFNEVYLKLPRWEDISANPDKFDIPNEPSLAYAMSGYLSEVGRQKSVCNTKQLHGLCKFIVRMPADMALLSFSPIIEKRHADLMKSATFEGWIKKNAHHLKAGHQSVLREE